MTPEQARERYPHGTIACYNHGKCRCVECMAVSSRYSREHRQATRAARVGVHPRPIVGKTVAVDIGKLVAVMTDMGFNPHSLSRGAGYHESTLPRIIHKGVCGYYTLDAIACFLGFHPIEFAVDKEGWWAV
jgi:hypothetical protein